METRYEIKTDLTGTCKRSESIFQWKFLLNYFKMLNAKAVFLFHIHLIFLKHKINAIRAQVQGKNRCDKRKKNKQNKKKN